MLLYLAPPVSAQLPIYSPSFDCFTFFSVSIVLIIVFEKARGLNGGESKTNDFTDWTDRRRQLAAQTIHFCNT
jgi:hypothetical protein